MMKKATILLGAITLLAFASCKKETTTTETVTPTGTETVTEETTMTPTNDTVVVKTEETNGTSVNVDANGVDVKSNDGTKKTSVEVKDGGAAVEVKK